MFIEQYIANIPTEHRDKFIRLMEVLRENLPDGFEETESYGMVGYVVPQTIYPDGYHCAPKLPLPFLTIACQKNFIAVYHMGIYSDEHLLNWFVEEFPKHSSKKLDMGKSCIRFKHGQEIPFDLIGELAQKMTVQDWIDRYEKMYKRK
jgi:succinate dehydrogenase flavin-adding protein (antitoxin of CptAB toxin-antitoxin module)